MFPVSGGSPPPEAPDRQKKSRARARSAKGEKSNDQSKLDQGRLAHVPPQRGARRRVRTGVAAPNIVAGPASDPQCMAPWTADTQFLQFAKKTGPYRIALANGYLANTWRIQMVQTAKAYAAQPDVKAKLKEFKVVSTGEDVPAQISAINNFIDSGYDAIVVDAQNPTAFGPVIKRAKEAGVVLVAFDNTLDTRTRSTSTSTRRASASCGPTG